ncbi:MAG: hypothetical protein Q3976_07095 [Corynebacterium sp.]|nr:hypothetical protein [Corynebacterium sp.]
MTSEQQNAPVAPSMNLARSGIRLFLGIALWWTGRLIAAFQWETVYYPRYFLVQDLGARTCTTVVDGPAPRMVCSAGHTWYSLGAIVGGLFVLWAGWGLLQMYRAIVRDNLKDTIDSNTALILSIGSFVVGICLIVQGSVDTITNPRVVDICFTAALIVLWIQVAWVAWDKFRRQPFDRVIPVFNLWAAIVSVALLVLSLGGFFFYVRSPQFSEFGMYQRISLEALSLWGLMLAAALTSTRFAGDDPAYRGAEESLGDSAAAESSAADQFAVAEDGPGSQGPVKSAGAKAAETTVAKSKADQDKAAKKKQSHT